MAITEPTQYTATKASGTSRRFIVSVTDGTTTWLFGNFEAIFTDGHIYHLVDTFNFSDGCDLWEDTFERSVVNLKVSNQPYKQNDDGWLRLADEIGDIINQSAYIYITADPNTSSLSDCLCIFTGITRNIENINGKDFTLKLEDNGYVVNTVLLTKTVKDAR